jgi:hypothetical protein
MVSISSAGFVFTGGFDDLDATGTGVGLGVAGATAG